MKRSAFLVALASTLFAPALIANADEVASPPPPLEIRAASSVYTGRNGAPTALSWVLRNAGSAPLHVRVSRAIHLAPGMRVPLRIVRATVGGNDVRELELAAGQSVTVDLTLAGFSDLAARAHEWAIELDVEVRGGGRAVGTTTVRRIPLPG